MKRKRLKELKKLFKRLSPPELRAYLAELVYVTEQAKERAKAQAPKSAKQRL